MGNARVSGDRRGHDATGRYVREFMPAMGHMTYPGISGTNDAVISGRLVRNVFKNFPVGHATEDRAALVCRAAFSLLHFNPAPLFQRLYLIHF